MKKLNFFNVKIRKKFVCLFSIIGILLLSINYTFCNPTKVNAYIAANVYSQPANSYFVDDNFYQCVVDNYNAENDASVSYTENLTDVQLETIKKLSCSSKKITDVTGIEKLKGLKSLDLSHNELTEIDLSGITLTSVGRDLSNNKLEKIILPSNLNIGNADYIIGKQYNRVTYVDFGNKRIINPIDSYSYVYDGYDRNIYIREQETLNTFFDNLNLENLIGRVYDSDGNEITNGNIEDGYTLKLYDGEKSAQSIKIIIYSTDFVDFEFYKCVVDNYNSKNNSSIAYWQGLSNEQIESITTLSCSTSYEINNVNEINEMPNLQELSITLI